MMLGNLECHGSFKDTHIVVKFEHKALAALDIESKPFDDATSALVLPPETTPTGWSYDVHQYIGDASHAEALYKPKMHLFTLATVVRCYPSVSRRSQYGADLGVSGLQKMYVDTKHMRRTSGAPRHWSRAV